MSLCLKKFTRLFLIASSTLVNAEKRLNILSIVFLASLCQPLFAEKKPNIIVIFTDDHGWADLGVQGIESDIRTPFLDELAKNGLRATNGYVTAPQCVPSRAGLLSGRYQTRFGVDGNGNDLKGFDAQQTIAERLQKAGYATGMAGKWHLGPPAKITTHGFDEVACDQGAPKGKYHLDANSEAACNFITKHAAQPFFYYLAYRAPHVPLDATQKYLDRFPGEMPERRRQCLAMMSAVDDGVGEVMKTLRQHKLEENTLIIFMGDNGAPLKITKRDKPGGGPGWDGSLNAPMNGEKGMLAEGGIRVPWIAYWKGKITPGQVYHHPVISLDVAATSLALAGLPADPALDGTNLIPHFSGENKAAPHDTLYWRWATQSAIRDGKWKLLIGGPHRYLFNLETDPGEKNNLLKNHPEIAAKLNDKLTTWAAELSPPGINTKTESGAAQKYFDHYLDGKTQEPKN